MIKPNSKITDIKTKKDPRTKKFTKDMIAPPEHVDDQKELDLPLGKVSFGDLSGTKALYDGYYYERGTPPDRYYIERFVYENAKDIRGSVMEFEDDSYTLKYGAEGVINCDVVNKDPGNQKATYVGDITSANFLPENQFDCIICTQTLMFVYDMKAAIAALYKALKPGGVLLITIPGIAQICHNREATWRDSWRVTKASVKWLLDESFPNGSYEIESHGNVKVAVSMLEGLALEEMSEEDLQVNDPFYPLIVTARVQKETSVVKKDDQPEKNDITSVPEKTAHQRVSIVMYSAERGEKHIEQAIECALSQTYKNLEVIVVDDGSKSAGKAKLKKEVLKKYEDNPRVRVIKNEKPSGLGKSLKKGFEEVTGKYHMWIKDIDFLKENAIESMVNYLVDHPTAEFVYSYYHKYNAETKEETLVKIPDYLDFSTENALGPCVMYTENCAKEIGEYEPTYGMASDYDYWTRVAKKYKMHLLPNSLCLIADEPYYGRHLARMYSYLFKRLIRYNSGFLHSENLEIGIWEFKDRLKRFSTSKMQYYKLLLKSIFRLYRISFNIGSLYLSLLYMDFYKTNIEPHIKGLIEWSKQTHLKIFAMRVRFKKCTKGTNALCIVPKVLLGGSEKVVMDVARLLGTEGYNFHLLAMKGNKVSWCQEFVKVFKKTILMSNKFHCYKLEQEESYYQHLRIVVKELNIKIILLSNPYLPYKCLDRLKEEFPELKVVDMIHLADFLTTSEELFPVLEHIDARVCISKGLRTHMIEKYKNNDVDPKYNDRVVSIYNGNDMDFYKRDESLKGDYKKRHNIDPDTKIISYISRLAPEKRPLIFVEVARKILDTLPNEKFKFVIAGEGTYLKSMEDRIRQLNMEEHFIVAGVIDYFEVKALLMDSFTLHIVSRIEGLPCISIEAMSMGVPVICTDVGSMHEAITSGENGFLAHPTEGTVDCFVEIIKKLCASPDLYKKISKNARPSILKEFSFEVFKEKYLKIFDELTKEPKPQEMSRIRNRLKGKHIDSPSKVG